MQGLFTSAWLFPAGTTLKADSVCRSAGQYFLFDSTLIIKVCICVQNWLCVVVCAVCRASQMRVCVHVTLCILCVSSFRACIDQRILLMSVGVNEFVSLPDLYEPERQIATISLLRHRSHIDWPPAMSVNR